MFILWWKKAAQGKIIVAGMVTLRRGKKMKFDTPMNIRDSLDKKEGGATRTADTDVLVQRPKLPLIASVSHWHGKKNIRAE